MQIVCVVLVHVMYETYSFEAPVPSGLTSGNLVPINRFLLAFWTILGNQSHTDCPGSMDVRLSPGLLTHIVSLLMDLQSAAWWEALGSSEQQIMLSDFHSKGIAVMVSAFGSTGLSSPHTGIEQLMGL